METRAMNESNKKSGDLCGGCGKEVNDHWLLLLTKLNSVDSADRKINSRLCDECAEKIHSGLEEND